MTAPIEAYVSVVARDCCLELKRRQPGDPSALCSGRHENWLVIVARGPIADELERSLRAANQVPVSRPSGHVATGGES